jgi:hypothetical protein
LHSMIVDKVLFEDSDVLCLPGFRLAPVQSPAIDYGALSRLAFSQAASFAPAMSQLAATNSIPSPAQLAPPTSYALKVFNEQEQVKAYANKLKRAYELHRSSLAKPLTTSPVAACGQEPAWQSSLTAPPAAGPPREQKIRLQANGIPAGSDDSNSSKPRTDESDNGDSSKPRTDEDKAAGSILLGFLSSLRQSYLDAVRVKRKMEAEGEEMAPIATVDMRGGGFSDQTGAPTVTDPSSSEDSDKETPSHSDKKTDPSSSEDSDKEISVRLSRGPPRKRLKTVKIPKKLRRHPSHGK